MVGVYKITSPSGKVYIGQSVDIDKRKRAYKNVNSLKGQPKIYHSMNKYGFENHIHEIIEECSSELLNERETFWKMYYLEQVSNDWTKVLFCELYDAGGGPKSEATKANMRKPKSEEAKKNMGHPISEETKVKMRKPKHSEEFKERSRQPKSDEVRLKISMARKGQRISDETKLKMSIAKQGKSTTWIKGKSKSEEEKLRRRNPCVVKGVEYISRWEAAETLNVTVNDISHWIRNPKPKYDDCYIIWKNKN